MAVWLVCKQAALSLKTPATEVPWFCFSAVGFRFQSDSNREKDNVQQKEEEKETKTLKASSY